MPETCTSFNQFYLFRVRYLKVIEYIYVTYVYANQYFSFKLTAEVLVLLHDAMAEAKCAMFSPVTAASSRNVIVAEAFHMGQAPTVSAADEHPQACYYSLYF